MTCTDMHTKTEYLLFFPAADERWKSAEKVKKKVKTKKEREKEKLYRQPCTLAGLGMRPGRGLLLGFRDATALLLGRSGIVQCRRQALAHLSYQPPL